MCGIEGRVSEGGKEDGGVRKCKEKIIIDTGRGTTDEYMSDIDRLCRLELPSSSSAAAAAAAAPRRR